MTLDTGLIERYRRDGVARLEQVVSPEWIEALRAGVEANMNRPGPYAKLYTPEGQPGKFFGDYCNWQRIPEYRAFFVESGLAAIGARLMGSRKVNLYHEQPARSSAHCSSASCAAARKGASNSLKRGKVFLNSWRSRSRPASPSSEKLRTGPSEASITAVVSTLRLGK